MSSRRFATPLKLEVGASTRIRIAVVAMHTIALGVVPMLPVAFFLQLLMAFSIAASLYFTWNRRHELGGSKVTLLLDADGQWYWQNGVGEKAVQLQGSSYITPYLVILNFRATENGKRYSIMLTEDNCDRDGLRRLRVRAKESAQAS